MAVLGVDGLALLHCEALARDLESDVPRGNEMHLDARQIVVPARFVGKGIGGHGSAEFAVDPGDEVQVERRGDAGGIVIGGFEDGAVLDQVHAD